ncbi:MAG: hypothetical protein R2836_06635 [Chitinophagales bacterium]
MQKNVVKWVLFGFIIILLFAFRIENDATQLSVANSINNFHKNNLNLFSKSIQTLENKENENLSENALKPYFLSCRRQFKHCEFCLPM